MAPYKNLWEKIFGKSNKTLHEENEKNLQYQREYYANLERERYIQEENNRKFLLQQRQLLKKYILEKEVVNIVIYNKDDDGRKIDKYYLLDKKFRMTENSFKWIIEELLEKYDFTCNTYHKDICKLTRKEIVDNWVYKQSNYSGKDSGIYKITNTINNKCYIGLSTNISERRRNHKNNGISKSNSSKKLYWAMKEYGIENFIFEVVEHCAVNELVQREIYWINKYDSFQNGYNDSKGGEGI